MGLRSIGDLSLVATYSSTSHCRCCRDNFLARQGLTRSMAITTIYHSQKQSWYLQKSVVLWRQKDEQRVGWSGFMVRFRIKHIIPNYKAYP